MSPGKPLAAGMCFQLGENRNDRNDSNGTRDTKVTTASSSVLAMKFCSTVLLQMRMSCLSFVDYTHGLKQKHTILAEDSYSDGCLPYMNASAWPGGVFGDERSALRSTRFYQSPMQCEY